MTKKNPTGCQERLENFLQAVEAAQKLQGDIIRYGLEAAHFYVEDVDGDWLERWDEDEEKQQNSIEYITKFLESNDQVAVKLRKRLKGKSLAEISSELESCLSFPQKADQIFAIKDLLLYNIRTREVNRVASDEYDVVNLVGLAEELLDKLVYLLDK